MENKLTKNNDKAPTPINNLTNIEKSIVKKFRKSLWSPFVRALKEYSMIEDGDVIAVAISGGKDSLLMAKLFQELHKYSDKNFTPVFISMNPGFFDKNLKQLKYNCEYLNIPVNYFDTDIFSVVDRISKDYPCYMCARMRRGALYDKAESLGCNKLALGHHYDDVIETTMMNLLYTGSFGTMLPILDSTNHAGMQIIRPLYNIREQDIIRFTNYNNINAMNCACSVAAGKIASSRREVKELIKTLSISNPNVEKCIFKAPKNINLDTCLGWKYKGKNNYFLD
ncbi:MAG: tRNA 2-thiocytidine biosynthesis TtcA family protein [Filifactoraceae bacterium]